MFPNNTNTNMYYNPQQIYPNYRQPSTIAGLKGRPVTSLEEARVASIDFDGSISFFPDLANGKIYTKQINNDGTVSMNCYSFTEIPAPKSEQELYMVKDLEEAIYYCSIVKAMEEKEKQPEVMYYREYPIYRDMDRYDGGRMYYDDGYMRYAGGNRGGSSGGNSNSGGSRGGSESGGSNSNSGGSSRNYEESSRGDAASRDRRGYDDMMVPYNNPYLMDYRQGRSPMARKSYMESKEMHQDKTSQMHELEKYLKELSNDITEMIDDASPEERAILRDKMTTLASKIK